MDTIEQICELQFAAVNEGILSWKLHLKGFSSWGIRAAVFQRPYILLEFPVFSPTYCFHVYYLFSPLKSCVLETEYRGKDSTPKITKTEDEEKIVVFHVFSFYFVFFK